MSNGDAEPLPEDGAQDQKEAPTVVSKARAVKVTTATKKRTAKTAVAKAPASNAAAKSTVAKSKAARSPVVTSTTAKRSKGPTSGHTRVRLGNSEMLVSREVAGALTDKDLKRLRAIFKRTLKRARKRDTKKKR